MNIERCDRSMSIEQDLPEQDLPQEDELGREIDRQQGPTDRDYERRWWTLGVLCISLVMIVMANASLNVALPTLVKDLARQFELAAVDRRRVQPRVRGPPAHRREPRRPLRTTPRAQRRARRLRRRVGLAAFSDSATAVIAARAVMGVGAAFVMPATLSILAHVFPPNERPRAIAIWAGVRRASASRSAA